MHKSTRELELEPPTSFGSRERRRRRRKEFAIQCNLTPSPKGIVNLLLN